jgi:tetratricopeptide (TPR) repeat protein
MNLKTIFFGTLVLVAVANAAPPKGGCDTETAKANAIREKCVKMGKGAAGYAKCAEDFKNQKAKAEQACRVGVLGSRSELESAVRKWEDHSNSRGCRSNDKWKNPNCPTILQQWGQELFKLEEYNFVEQQNKYEELVQWCADRGNDLKRYPQCSKTSTPPKANHDASLPIFLEYVRYFPDGKVAPNMLFQASFILETKGELKQALDLRKTLVSKYPNHTLASGAWLRIGEYYYNNEKWADAIKAYEKITNIPTDNPRVKKEAAYAQYHLAESYYNLDDYERAAYEFWAYIDGADKGKYIKDMRVEAMDYMAVAFSDLDDGIYVADKFIKSKRVPYKDSLYFRIGQRAKDHERYDQAIKAFDFLIETNPTYIDAPLADLAMVDIYLLQQKPDKAQEQRFKVAKRYDRNSAWYRKNSMYPESVKAADDAMRRSMLEIPVYIYVKAVDLFKKGNPEGAKKYAEAIQHYENFIARYKNEPDWREYQAHMNMALVYQELGQFEKQAEQYNWIINADTTRYGRRPQNLGVILSKNEAKQLLEEIRQEKRERSK